MGRLSANFARLDNPMQDCHLGKKPHNSSHTAAPYYFQCRNPATDKYE